MRRVGPAMLLLLAACGDSSAEGDDWERLDVPAAAGVTFEDVSVVGDVTFAVGSRDGRGAVLRIEGDAWESIDTPEVPPVGAVYAAGPEDVWVATKSLRGPAPESGAPLLMRWDGAAWSSVDLGVDGRFVRDVWGTGPDDVWLTAMLDQGDVQSTFLHWDGAAMTAEEDVLPMVGIDPTSELLPGLGCSRAPGDVSLVLNSHDLGPTPGWSLRLREGTWRAQTMVLAALDLACDGEQAWAIGHAEPPVARAVLLDEGTGWRSVVTSSDERYELADVAAGELWVLGYGASGDDGGDRGVIWRYRDGGLRLSASEPMGPGGELPLRAVYEAPSGEVRALGADGLALALRRSP